MESSQEDAGDLFGGWKGISQQLTDTKQCSGVTEQAHCS